jgi:hypothetical protein
MPRSQISQNDDEACAAYCLLTLLREFNRIPQSSFNDRYAEKIIWPEIKRGSNANGLPPNQSSPAHICKLFERSRATSEYRGPCVLYEDDARMNALVQQYPALNTLRDGYKNELISTSVGSIRLPKSAAALLENNARVLLFVLNSGDIATAPTSAHTLLARNDGGIYLMDPADGSDTMLDGPDWEDFVIGTEATPPVAKKIGNGHYIFTGSCIRIG